MKKVKNILCMVLLLTIIFSVFVQLKVYAEGSGSYRSTMGGLIDETYKGNSKGNANEKVTNVMNGIISVVRVVGMCIAITLLLVIAMKYMTAAPGEKADIKKASIAYVVGALVLFGAVGILGIISDFASSNITATTN